MSPTKRALKFYRDLGCACVVLEKWIPRAKVRKDIWGADILALQGRALLAIQATDGTSHGKHITKCLENPEVANWLTGGAHFYIYSESLRGRGEVKKWTPRITQLVLNDGGKVEVL